ncbi:uncharacterized protein [Nicotiana sylvestris]|uniref:uncharacterized protein n=1 Tax=Nicotiana sylvestris TaxID=4096 RepID=UPI00388C45FE
MRAVMRFKKKGKLNPRFIGPFEVLRRLGEVAYELVLPPGLAVVHPVFHVSMLRMYHGDLSHVLEFRSVQFDKDLSYVEELVAILDRQVRKLRSKNIASLKVQWSGLPVEEATWKAEHDMCSRYPHNMNHDPPMYCFLYFILCLCDLSGFLTVNSLLHR